MQGDYLRFAPPAHVRRLLHGATLTLASVPVLVATVPVVVGLSSLVHVNLRQSNLPMLAVQLAIVVWLAGLGMLTSRSPMQTQPDSWLSARTIGRASLMLAVALAVVYMLATKPLAGSAGPRRPASADLSLAMDLAMAVCFATALLAEARSMIRLALRIPDQMLLRDCRRLFVLLAGVTAILLPCMGLVRSGMVGSGLFFTIRGLTGATIEGLYLLGMASAFMLGLYRLFLLARLRRRLREQLLLAEVNLYGQKFLP